jgi:hypothetical protein
MGISSKAQFWVKNMSFKLAFGRIYDFADKA